MLVLTSGGEMNDVTTTKPTEDLDDDAVVDGSNARVWKMKL